MTCSRNQTILRFGWSLSAVLCGFFLPGTILADPLGAGGGTIYRLTESKSTFQRGCFPPCMCPIWEGRPVRGTLRLTYTGNDGSMDVYAVQDVNWVLPYSDLELWMTGSGTYRIGSPGPLTVLQHRIELDLEVGDDPAEHYDSGLVNVGNFPDIDITVSIHGMFCLDTAIHLDARAVPNSEIISYNMLGGSTFQRGCFDPCDCLLEEERPVVGRFDLVPLADNSLFRDFGLVNLTWQVLPSSNTAGDTIPIKGVGMYSVGGEFAAQHRLSLELAVGDDPLTHYDSGWAIGGTTFPTLDIVVSINGIECYDTVIHALAGPKNGAVCGGFAGIPCPPGQFCKYAAGECCCDFQGVCQSIPEACITLWDPVCGCDGATYGNECEADHAGVAIDYLGECHNACSATNTDPCVKVVLDMDGATPGIQSTINVPEGTTVVRDVAVYVLDPSESHSMWGIGYIGGLDRGIAFGHTPADADNQGHVIGVKTHAGAPVNPQNTQLIFPAMDKGFEGAEIQYVEINATQPATIPANPLQPIFHADVMLRGAQAGDVFGFYVLDFVSVWSGGSSGAFSTQDGMSLDTGGDAVADGTQTAMGVDPDAPVGVPPGSFRVDYIDGPPSGGPATITVVAGPNPIPTVSELGAYVMSALILAAGGVILHRRRQMSR